MHREVTLVFTRHKLEYLKAHMASASEQVMMSFSPAMPFFVFNLEFDSTEEGFVYLHIENSVTSHFFTILLASGLITHCGFMQNIKNNTTASLLFPKPPRD